MRRSRSDPTLDREEASACFVAWFFLVAAETRTEAAGSLPVDEWVFCRKGLSSRTGTSTTHCHCGGYRQVAINLATGDEIL